MRKSVGAEEARRLIEKPHQPAPLPRPALPPCRFTHGRADTDALAARREQDALWLSSRHRACLASDDGPGRIAIACAATGKTAATRVAIFSPLRDMANWRRELAATATAPREVTICDYSRLSQDSLRLLLSRQALVILDRPREAVLEMLRTSGENHQGLLWLLEPGTPAPFPQDTLPHHRQSGPLLPAILWRPDLLPEEGTPPWLRRLERTAELARVAEKLAGGDHDGAIRQFFLREESIAFYRKLLEMDKAGAITADVVRLMEQNPEQTLAIVASHRDTIRRLARELRFLSPVAIAGRQDPAERRRRLTALAGRPERRLLLADCDAFARGHGVAACDRILLLAPAPQAAASFLATQEKRRRRSGKPLRIDLCLREGRLDDRCFHPGRRNAE